MRQREDMHDLTPMTLSPPLPFLLLLAGVVQLAVGISCWRKPFRRVEPAARDLRRTLWPSVGPWLETTAMLWLMGLSDESLQVVSEGETHA